MKNINKTSLIFTALSKMLFYSDAAQMPPQMPNPANNTPLVVAVQRTPLLNPAHTEPVLTYDNVLEYVGRVGFVLQMMETETKGSHVEIGEIRKRLWAKTDKMWEVFHEECSPIYASNNKGLGIFREQEGSFRTRMEKCMVKKKDILKDLCDYCEDITKSIPLDLIKKEYVEFDPNPAPIFVLDFGDRRIELTYDYLAALVVYLQRNSLRCEYKYVRMMNNAAEDLIHIFRSECVYALTDEPGNTGLRAPGYYKVFQGELKTFIYFYQRKKEDISRERERIFKKVYEDCKTVQKKLDEIEKSEPNSK